VVLADLARGRGSRGVTGQRHRDDSGEGPGDVRSGWDGRSRPRTKRVGV
jgi:hypothetical protein